MPFSLLIFFVTSLSGAHARMASAAPLPAAYRVSAEEFDETLKDIDLQSRHAALVLGATNLAVGVGHIVGAAFAMHRHATGPAIGTFVGGGFSLFSGAAQLTFARAPFRKVRAQWTDRGNAQTDGQVMATTYEAWQKQAQATHAFRRLFGTSMAVAGALMVGFSTANLIADFPFMAKQASVTDRGAFGGVLLGLSGFVLVNGVTLALSPSPIETRLPHSVPVPLLAQRARPQWQFALLDRGAFAGVHLPF